MTYLPSIGVSRFIGGSFEGAHPCIRGWPRFAPADLDVDYWVNGPFEYPPSWVLGLTYGAEFRVAYSLDHSGGGASDDLIIGPEGYPYPEPPLFPEPGRRESLLWATTWSGEITGFPVAPKLYYLFSDFAETGSSVFIQLGSRPWYSLDGDSWFPDLRVRITADDTEEFPSSSFIELTPVPSVFFNDVYAGISLIVGGRELPMRFSSAPGSREPNVEGSIEIELLGLLKEV